MLGCMYALLLAGANTQLIDKEGRTAQQVKGQPITTELFEQHAAPPQPASPDTGDPAMDEPAMDSPAALSSAAESPSGALYLGTTAESRPAFAAPAPPDAGDPAVDSPDPLPRNIMLAAKQGKVTQVVSWLNKGGLVNAIGSVANGDGTGRMINVTLLWVATEGTNPEPEMVRVLLNKGANVNWQDSEGVTALMKAVDKGHLPTANVLLQAKDPAINIDLKNIRGNVFMDGGMTALMTAAAKGRSGCVERLLLAKANPELQSDNGLTALQHAERKNYKGTAQILRQHTSPPQPALLSRAAVPDAGEPAMNFLASGIIQAAEQGEVQKVVDWLDEGWLVDAVYSIPTKDGRTESASLLHLAASANQPKMVKMLLEQGASVDLQTSEGVTALMFALLYHKGPDGKGPEREGHYACVKLLLLAKANPELQAKEGQTALRHAKVNSRKAIMELIQKYVAEAKAKAQAAEVTRLAAEVDSVEVENTCLAVGAAMMTVGVGVAFARWR